MEEAGLDQRRVGDAAPQPAEGVAAIGRDFAGPRRFEIAAAEPFGDEADRLGLLRFLERRVERAEQRQRLDQRRVIFARGVAHQGAHPPGVLDQRAQFVARTLLRAFEHEPLEPGADQIFVERGIVLEVGFAAPARDLVERRLGDEEVPGLDQVRHLAVEEGQQQGADVRAVDVGVGHDHDLVIAQLVEAELLAADAGAERLDHRPDFLRAEHPVEARALDVEDLALQRKDRLILAVAALLGRAAGAVALDQEQLGLGGIALRAIVQFAR